MKIIDCYWEKLNIGAETVEIEVESDDVYNEEEICKVEKEYDYIIVKVPMKMLLINFGLAKRGYTLAEVQCKLSKDYKDFDFEDRLIQRILPHVSFKEVENSSDLRNIICNITPGMFSTDRISLDPAFGLDKACNRYRNWISNTVQNGKNKLMSIIYDDKEVGFSLYSEVDSNIEMVLGGIYEQCQSRGLGIITPTRHILQAYKLGIPLKKISTTISSNNSPVWRIYNHFNFKVENLSYVFIKHADNQIGK